MRDRSVQPATGERSALAATDAQLVLRARLDRRAFAPLYDRHFDAVFRYCFYRLGDWQEAEDAAADVFATVLAELARFRDVEREEGFRCWVFTIARNLVANRRRDRRVEPPLEAAALVHDTAPTPEESALVADDHRIVLALLARLNPGRRELLELRLAGLNDAEIARLLGRSHDAVRKEQSRTIRVLRSLMATSLGAEREVPHA